MPTQKVFEQGSNRDMDPSEKMKRMQPTESSHIVTSEKMKRTQSTESSYIVTSGMQQRQSLLKLDSQFEEYIARLESMPSTKRIRRRLACVRHERTECAAVGADFQTFVDSPEFDDVEKVLQRILITKQEIRAAKAQAHSITETLEQLRDMDSLQTQIDSLTQVTTNHSGSRDKISEIQKEHDALLQLVQNEDRGALKLALIRVRARRVALQLEEETLNGCVGRLRYTEFGLKREDSDARRCSCSF
jgi:hypothetical protein